MCVWEGGGVCKREREKERERIGIGDAVIIITATIYGAPILYLALSVIILLQYSQEITFITCSK